MSLMPTARIGVKNRREESLQKALLPAAAWKKFKAAWALKNIASATSEHTGDATVLIVKLLVSPSANVREQVLPLIKEILISSTNEDEDVLRMACWALSYISEDRDDIQAILDADVGQHLVKLLRYSSNSVFYPALRTVSNIFARFYHIQNVNHKINADSVVSLARLIQNRRLLKERVLPFLKEKLISSTDEDVLRVACWVLSCISDNGDYVQAILDAVGQQLVKLLKQLTSNSVFYPVIRTVANIFAGYDNQIQFMMIKTHWIAGKDY